LRQLSAKGGIVDAASANLTQLVKDAKSFEGVLSVKDASAVDLSQVALDVGARERGAAEQHRH